MNPIRKCRGAENVLINVLTDSFSDSHSWKTNNDLTNDVLFKAGYLRSIHRTMLSLNMKYVSGDLMSEMIIIDVLIGLFCISNS